MKTLKRRTLGLSVGFLSMLLLILVCATSAFADGGGSLDPTINPGSLGVGNNGSASIDTPSTLNGTDQSLAIHVPLTVTDATGSGAGWHLTVLATQFSTAADASPFRTLSDTATTFTNVTSRACHSGSTCSLPTNNKSLGSTVPTEDASSDGSTISYGSATPLSFYNAATDTGMGVMDLTANFSVALTANTTYAGSFSSSITISIASTP